MKMMFRSRSVLLFTGFVSLLAITSLQLIYVQKKSIGIVREVENVPYRDENFFKWSNKSVRPFTPKDTVGTTSFRLFDKAKHVENEFGFPSKLMSSRTEGTVDFIIAGFPKCGTTFMMGYMGNDNDIKMVDREQCQFFKGYGHQTESGISYKGPMAFMEALETLRNNVLTDRQKLSFKCPNAIVDEGFDEVMSSYYPTTDIIIGIRHPIQFFRSFYNFRMGQKSYDPMPLVHELIGSNCHHNHMNSLCTDYPKYALALSKLGKTDLGEAEVDLLASMVYEQDPYYEMKYNAITNYFDDFQRPKMGRIFLYALEQMGDQDEGRVDKFVEDLSSFVGLDHTMEEPPEHDAAPLSGSSTNDGDDIDDDGDQNENHPSKHRRGLREYYSDFEEGGKWKSKYQTHGMRKEIKMRHKKMQIDICDNMYNDVRELLVKEGALTAKWIREYFLEAEDVVVSQRDHFERILDSFSVDPCMK